MGPIYSLDDFFDMIRRHMRMILGLILLGCFVSLIVAQNQTHLYRSAEVIQIERPKIANDLARSTVAGSSARRLQLIEQQVMARESLLSIIEKFNLFADMPGLTDTEKVSRLRDAVRIDGVAAVREGFADDGTISVLTITADMDTAELAQAVAQEFSDRTIALSADSRAEQTRATLEFFSRQEEQLSQELTALEDNIAAFRAENDLALVGSLDFRRSEIASVNDDLLDLERDRIATQRQLDQVNTNARRATVERETTELNAQLEDLDAQRKLLEARAESLRASLETTPEIERRLSNFERQRNQLQGQLNVITTRRAEAEVGVTLEDRNNAENLRVIEAAPLPEYPFTASKKKLALMGAVASVLGAIGLAFVLDLFKPVLRSPEQMKREIGLAPVVSIPVLDPRIGRPSMWQTLQTRASRMLPRVQHSALLGKLKLK